MMVRYSLINVICSKIIDCGQTEKKHAEVVYILYSTNVVSGVITMQLSTWRGANQNHYGRKLFCQKLIATLNCPLVYVMPSVFDSLLTNQLKTTRHV
jgi:hypothetical protein